MRIPISILAAVFSVAIGNVARADESAGDVSQKSENAALALSLGGEAVSLGLLMAPVIHDALDDGCTNGGAVGDGGLDQCGGPHPDLLPTLAVIGAAGTLVAPSLGHWYAGDGWSRGMTIRLAGAGVVGLGALWVGASCLPGGCDGPEGPGVVVAALGGVAYLVGSFDDIATTRKAVRERNARVRELTLVPAPAKGGGAALLLSGRF